MRDGRLGFVLCAFAAGAIAGLAGCSGAGSGGAAGGASDVPAVSSGSTLPSSSTPAKSESPAAVAPDAILTSSDDIDATDIAALAVPLTSDVAPVGDAAPDIEYNWNLNGSYTGLIKQWQDGVERVGRISFVVTNNPPKPAFAGTGTIVIGQSSDISMIGQIIATYQHSIGLRFALSFGPNETCFTIGIARRYRHVFEGVLRSPSGGAGCATAANSTTYFKVHPSS